MIIYSTVLQFFRTWRSALETIWHMIGLRIVPLIHLLVEHLCTIKCIVIFLRSDCASLSSNNKIVSTVFCLILLLIAARPLLVIEMCCFYRIKILNLRLVLRWIFERRYFAQFQFFLTASYTLTFVLEPIIFRDTILFISVLRNI